VSVNKVILLGNLGADPEVRTTPQGQLVATLSLATSESFKDKHGSRHERTEWHRVVLWGQQAELAQRYLQKGRKVYIEGRLTTRSWDDQQTGQKRYSTEIVASQMTFVDRGEDHGEREAPRHESRPENRPSQRSQGQGQRATQAPPQAPPRSPDEPGYFDDDVPF